MLLGNSSYAVGRSINIVYEYLEGCFLNLILIYVTVWHELQGYLLAECLEVGFRS